MYCDPCLSELLEEPAVVHCEECNESFCEACKGFHSKVKLLKTHTLRSVQMVPSQQERNYLTELKACSCSSQPSRHIEYFCTDHDAFCCVKCGFSKHRKCQTFDEVTDVIGQRTDTTFDAPFRVLEQKIQELTEIATSNNKLAEDSYTDVEQRLMKVKRAIDDAYNDLKMSILSDANSRRQRLMDDIQKQNQNIEALSMKLNEQKVKAETVSKYGTGLDKYVFSHMFERSSLKDMNKSESQIRSSLIPRQFTIKEKHSFDDIVEKLKEAIEVVDKELVTGSDSHDGTGPDTFAIQQKQTSPVVLPGPELARRMKVGTRVMLSRDGRLFNMETTPVVLTGPELARRMKPGTRVVRGRDWAWGNQALKGDTGTVIEGLKNGTVKVKWDFAGLIARYKMGMDGQYHLTLADQH